MKEQNEHVLAYERPCVCVTAAFAARLICYSPGKPQDGGLEELTIDDIQDWT